MRPESQIPTSSRRGPGDDALGAALRALPSETAGPGFTARVLARLDGDEQPEIRPLRRAPAVWAALAAAALAATIGLALLRSGAPPEESVRTAEAVPVVPASRPPAEAAPPAAEDRAPETAPAAPVPAPQRSSGRQEPRHPPASAATADASLASAGPAAQAVDARSALARLRAELDAVRQEHRRFELGLADLPELGSDGEPVVYVGGDEGLGLVLDLGLENAPSPGRRNDRESGTSL